MRSRLVPLALAAATLTLAACATDPAVPDDEIALDDDYSAVAGAEELAEPQLALTTIDPTGQVTHLDLLDESVTALGRVGAPTAMATDGRYLFAQTEAGVEVVDSGVWSWDHIDHFHYYRADSRIVGIVGGDGDATVATANLSTAGGTGLYFADSGEAVLLDNEALSQGEIVERFRLQTDAHDGMVVPVGSFALVTEADDTGISVLGYTGEGEPTGLEVPCAEASGTITTRVGSVIGCRDGALLATVEEGELQIEAIPYPEGTTAPAASSFDNRKGRPTVAGLAGTEGIWLLDTRARSWNLIPAPAPLLSVTAVDDGPGHVLALGEDGRVLVIDGSDGALLAETEPLVAASLEAGEAPVIIADQQRGYLSAPAEQRLYEIDFADGARIARTFETASAPAFTAETGR